MLFLVLFVKDLSCKLSRFYEYEVRAIVSLTVKPIPCKQMVLYKQ